MPIKRNHYCHAAKARLGWWVAAAICAISVMASAGALSARAAGESGLPLPRYVSLKSDKVNLRKGPGTDYPIVWVFRKAGLPVEVVKEYRGWRQIRDADGGTGWVYGPMLSGRRTALVLPWKLKVTPPVQTELFKERGGGTGIVAYVRAGVLANVNNCNGAWCKVTIGSIRGFVRQEKLWGIYPDEHVN